MDLAHPGATLMLRATNAVRLKRPKVSRIAYRAGAQISARLPHTSFEHLEDHTTIKTSLAKPGLW